MNDDVRQAALMYSRMRAEYAPDGTIFDRDEPRVAACKRIVAELGLPGDRELFTLYTDLGSIRKLAALLGISRGSCHKEIRRIRKIVIDEYERRRSGNDTYRG